MRRSVGRENMGANPMEQLEHTYNTRYYHDLFQGQETSANVRWRNLRDVKRRGTWLGDSASSSSPLRTPRRQLTAQQAYANTAYKATDHELRVRVRCSLDR